MKLQNLFTMSALSESAMVLSFGSETSMQTTRRIKDVDAAIRLQPFDGFIETVPAFTTLTVFYDVVSLRQDSALKGDFTFDKLRNYFEKLEIIPLAHLAEDTFLIPVCYADEYAPDMKDVMDHTGLDRQTIIDIHSSIEYEVLMLGFMPGFPYLSGMDKRLSTPRRAQPRSHVPPGSLGIGGTHTGIYPFAAPGGWNLIGRTPMELFSFQQTPPALLHAGSRVKFSPISSEEFIRLVN